MKAISILVSVFLLLGTVISGADEVSDLKKQVKQLEKKVEELDNKQQEQAKEIEKIPEVADSVDELYQQPSAAAAVAEALGKQTTLGGHFKFFLADQSFGKVNGDSQHNSFSMGINNLWLYFNKTLTDWLQLTVAPNVMVLAEATPSLGNDITRPGSANVDVDLDEAYMTIRLPHEFEIRAGAFYPLFSADYGTKSWWHEQYHGNNGLMTLQEWKSTGVEVYRNFDFEKFSLPVFLYFLNGENRGIIQDSRFTDNNSAKNFLLHLSPEFIAYNSRIKILGSLGGGKWDDSGDKDSFQWAAGSEINYSSYSFSGEYLYRWREDLPLTGGGVESGVDKGFYVKAKYILDDKWQFLLKYSNVELWSTSANFLQTDNYKSLSGTVGYGFTESSTIIPQVEYVDAERDGTAETLEYLRYTIGWRTTF